MISDGLRRVSNQAWEDRSNTHLSRMSLARAKASSRRSSSEAASSSFKGGTNISTSAVSALSTRWSPIDSSEDHLACRVLVLRKCVQGIWGAIDNKKVLAPYSYSSGTCDINLKSKIFRPNDILGLLQASINGRKAVITTRNGPRLS